ESRILGARQSPIGDVAAQGDDDRDDGGKDRPIDEEVGESHADASMSSPGLAYCALAVSATALISPSSGLTFWPGRARGSPSMTMRSVAAKPERTTRSPSTIGPSSTSLPPTVPSSATVTTIFRDSPEATPCPGTTSPPGC